MNPPKKSLILFVLKDMGAANMAGLLIQECVRDHDVVIITEDRAGEGLRSKFGITPDIDASITPLSPSSFFDAREPDVVIVGIGSPIKLELAFLREARARGIPTVALEDFHGNHKRLLGCNPDVLCVIDAHAAQLSRHARMESRVVIVGNPGIYTGTPSDVARDRIQKLRALHGAVYAFAGSETFDDLALAVECMEKSRGCLVPMIHPKYSGRVIPGAGTETFDERWRRMLAPITFRTAWLSGISSEEITALSDGLFSGYSILMYTAAWHQKPVFALNTREVQQRLSAQSHASVVPITALGVTHVIDAPRDVGGLACLPAPDALIPHDVRVAYTTILSLL